MQYTEVMLHFNGIRIISQKDFYFKIKIHRNLIKNIPFQRPTKMKLNMNGIIVHSGQNE